MVGRKSNATIIGPNAYLPAELYTISYSTEFVRGAKTEIRDDDGKLLYNAKTSMRTHPMETYTKEQAESFKSFLHEQGIKNIKLHKPKWDFPSKCPSCHNYGTPNIYNWKGTLRSGEGYKEIKRDSLKLIYNHSKTKPKTCLVGTVDLDSTIPQIKLKPGLPIDSLLHRRRVGVYPL